MTRLSALAALALCAALAATSLAGCGVKGPLEPPPSTQAGEAVSRESQPRPGPAMTEDGQPIAQPGQRRRIFLDWLLN